ncbi:uncharacterized protein UTRI_10300 [Ustilago trichophora]|uniref:Uncharacterized protein n=1 Tax=Ustilago trichophora TaxID=86804 RepID=A0A5C3ELW3_9BASI|nr:uncharacterized protein UTRI_10300 [Ustilago trichophora]
MALLYAVAIVLKKKKKDGKAEFGEGQFPIFEKEGKLVRHLGSHFFGYELVGNKAQVQVRVPASTRNELVKCCVVGCKWQTPRRNDDDRAFLTHVVNIHKLPILRYGNGDFVEDVEEDALKDLTPYVTTPSENGQGIELKLADGVRDNRIFASMRSRFVQRTREAARPSEDISKEDHLARRRQNYKQRLAKLSEVERRAFWDRESERTRDSAQRNRDSKGKGTAKRKRKDLEEDTDVSDFDIMGDNDSDIEYIGHNWTRSKEPEARKTQSSAANARKGQASSSKVTLDD